MIDSGATGSFIDTKFIKKNKIPFISKDIPIQLNVIDGRKISSGDITTQTELLTLNIENHQEVITLDITRLKKYPIILGIPWLIKHNPLIIWKEYELHLNSDQYKKMCNNLNSNTESEYGNKGKNDNSLNLFDHKVIATTLGQTNENIPMNIKIPKEYHDFIDVFDEKASNQLPPHRPYIEAHAHWPARGLPCYPHGP